MLESEYESGSSADFQCSFKVLLQRAEGGDHYCLADDGTYVLLSISGLSPRVSVAPELINCKVTRYVTKITRLPIFYSLYAIQTIFLTRKKSF